MSNVSLNEEVVVTCFLFRDAQQKENQMSEERKKRMLFALLKMMGENKNATNAN